MPSNCPEYAVVGNRLPKMEAEYLVNGQAQYLDDLKLPGMLCGKILRSPHAHARIINIDISRAQRLPDVEAVITAEDTPKIKFCHLPVTPNKMALNDQKVRFIGDEVAAVAAKDWETASEALELIKVEYEILPAVFDPDEAMSLGAPQVHEDCPDNIAGHFVREFGNVEKGFSESDAVFEDRFSTPFVASCSLEPHGCIAFFDSGGRLTFWGSIQNPVNFQRALSQVVQISQNKVRVIRTCVGGSFGNKTVILPMDPIAAFLSQKTGRPVKLVNTREEEFTTSRGRYPMIIYLKTGVKKDGTLLARQAKVITNNGAYNNKASGISALTCNRIGNLYRVPHTRTESIIVYTNTQYGGALRGWGGPQAHFAVESQMDIIAEALNLDPLELRLKNANQPGETTPWGWTISSCGLSQCLKEAAERASWETKRKQYGARGVGIASVLHTGAGSAGTHGAGNFSEVFLKVNPDASVQVLVGESDTGQGSDTALAQIIAEVLGVNIESITITSNDTDVIPPTMGTWGSRVTFIAGNAAKLAAEKARDQLIEAAAKLLGGVANSDLMAASGKIYLKSLPSKAVTLREAAQYCVKTFGKPVSARAVYNPPNANPPDPKTGYGNYCPTYSFGAQAVEVEVDPDTGKVRVLNVVAAHDLGRAINPLLVEGQIHGGVAMGLGFALFEGTKIKQGKTLNNNFSTYKIPNSTEMPLINEVLIETLDPEGPFNAKGIGEPCLIPMAPAIANAIYNAVGVRVKDLPITPDKILAELWSRRGKDLEFEKK